MERKVHEASGLGHTESYLISDLEVALLFHTVGSTGNSARDFMSKRQWRLMEGICLGAFVFSSRTWERRGTAAQAPAGNSVSPVPLLLSPSLSSPPPSHPPDSSNHHIWIQLGNKKLSVNAPTSSALSPPLQNSGSHRVGVGWGVKKALGSLSPNLQG